jgi:hypothetical protein
MSNLKSNRSKNNQPSYAKIAEDRPAKYGRVPRNEPNNKSDRSRNALKNVNLV